MVGSASFDRPMISISVCQLHVSMHAGSTEQATVELMQFSLACKHPSDLLLVTHTEVEATGCLLGEALKQEEL